MEMDTKGMVELELKSVAMVDGLQEITGIMIDDGKTI